MVNRISKLVDLSSHGRGCRLSYYTDTKQGEVGDVLEDIFPNGLNNSFTSIDGVAVTFRDKMIADSRVCYDGRSKQVRSR